MNKYNIPIYKKVGITLEEASEYSSIGINKLREITNNPHCPFVFYIGTKKIIKRRKFEEFIDNLYSV